MFAVLNSSSWDLYMDTLASETDETSERLGKQVGKQVGKINFSRLMGKTAIFRCPLSQSLKCC